MYTIRAGIYNGNDTVLEPQDLGEFEDLRDAVLAFANALQSPPPKIGRPKGSKTRKGIQTDATVDELLGVPNGSSSLS